MPQAAHRRPGARSGAPRGRSPRKALAAVAAAALVGCGAPHPPQEDERLDAHRAQRREAGGVLVAAAALGRSESLMTFGAPLNDFGVQPVWIRVQNRSDHARWLFPIAVDRDYFPAYEVARRATAPDPASPEAPQDRHEEPRLTTEALYRRLEEVRMPRIIPAGESRSGFVYAHHDEGMKAFVVELHGGDEVQRFSFVVPVPGLPTPYLDIVDDRAAADDGAPALDEEGLRRWLEGVGCCTRNGDGVPGDPLNVVLVATTGALRQGLVARHWDVTAEVSGTSLWRLTRAFLFGSRYRYAPVSPLYAFDREHDLAFQKARATIDERNHMRLWRAPVTLAGTPVWVGQVSRDVGVKASGRLWPPTTHIIDPDVDEARFYLVQDLLTAEAVERVAFVRGLEAAPQTAPRTNAEDDPYFTDGLRVVLFLTEEPTPPSAVHILDWELPPAMEPHRNEYVSAPPR